MEYLCIKGKALANEELNYMIPVNQEVPFIGSKEQFVDWNCKNAVFRSKLICRKPFCGISYITDILKMASFFETVALPVACGCLTFKNYDYEEK
jgi:hypothetical protein